MITMSCAYNQSSHSGISENHSSLSHLAFSLQTSEQRQLGFGSRDGHEPCVKHLNRLWNMTFLSCLSYKKSTETKIK